MSESASETPYAGAVEVPDSCPQEKNLARGRSESPGQREPEPFEKPFKSRFPLPPVAADRWSESRSSESNRKPFASSDVFKQVMADMYGASDYQKGQWLQAKKKKLKAFTLASRLFRTHPHQHQQAADEPTAPDDDDDDNDGHVTGGGGDTRQRRNWKLIRDHVERKRVERKFCGARINWTLLQHRLETARDLEHAKVDLYRRYGVLPQVSRSEEAETARQPFSPPEAVTQPFPPAGKFGRKKTRLPKIERKPTN